MKKDGLNLFDWKHTEEKDGYETTLFLIPNLGGREFRGTIEVFVGEMFSNVTYSTDYMLYIKYSDWKNENDYQRPPETNLLGQRGRYYH